MTIKLAPRQLFIIISFGLLINCGRDKAIATDNSDGVDTVFIEFIDNVRNQTLPLHISCGLTDNLASADEFEKFKNYIPKRMDRVFGKIESQNNKYRLIIYGLTGDDIYPFLYSYDNGGQVRDSLDLMLTGCGAADETAIPHAFASISKDLTITLIDTTRLIHYPGHWEKVPTDKGLDSAFISTGDYIIDSTRVKKVIFKVDEKGRFVKE